MLLAVEEHAPGKQLLRFRLSQTHSRLAIALASVFAAMSLAAAFYGAWVQSIISGLGAVIMIERSLIDSWLATGMLSDLVRTLGES